ncbi:MAG: hypothetical protein HUJ56_04730 [Erysipelotrichaceae bacterium]|nr:hypothetical protein [Erysipelotrichaceae bacterium]
MKYISSDTNVWLDFQEIGRTDLPFRLSCTYIMYKEALKKEIISPPELIDELIRRGLVGVELTVDELFYALDIAKKYAKLSDFDRTALAIAKFRNIPLLTGDNPLRKAAKKEGVEVFGTIGLLDKLYAGELINKLEYKYCLESLLEHKERRLPVDELKKRIESL